MAREAGGQMTAMAPVDIATEQGANDWVPKRSLCSAASTSW